jgi:hypothetical protein
MNILKANKYIIFTEGSAKVAKNKSEIMIFFSTSFSKHFKKHSLIN